MLIDELPKVRGSYRENADLSKINWFNVGGKAQIMFRPQDITDLSNFLKEKPSDLNVTILGVGSNLLIRDGGIDGVVIRLGRGFTDLTIHKDTIHAGAGTLSFNLATFAANHSIKGLEFLSGIPGTVGGALAMNAGAYQNETCSILEAAEMIDEAGNIHLVKTQDIGYIYRGNTLPNGIIFTKGIFKAEEGSKKQIQQEMNEITSKREETQPIKSRTSGSTFRNPDGYKAWKLIDEAGCRGLEEGGAKVSEQHCNFFINTGNATAKDIESLGKKVQEKVLKNSGIKLEWEVKIIGKEL